ncbi:MAG: ABC transporter permease/substrate-binding protein [Gammaproteobacteria bacterium]
MTEQLALLPGYLTAHLQLSLSALLVGIAISVPVGVLVSRIPRFEQPVLAIASVIQTIPSLALLAIMVPLLAALGLPSIGFLPAFFGLVLYSLLPVLTNTVTGLATVDPAAREAARGVGMTDLQQLRRVELPLAMPVIVGGIRTATVWTVGAATLSTPVGATSLGNYIFTGLQTRNLSAVLMGCVACAVLALVLDGLVRLAGLGIVQRRRRMLALALAVLASLFAYAGYSWGRQLLESGSAEFVVGAKTFTEQYILSELLVDQVEALSGTSAKVSQSLGSTVAFDALRTDQIDAYVEYSGTVWSSLMRRREPPPARPLVLQAVKEYLRTEYGIAVVASLGFENAYALAVRRDLAERLGLGKISDLRKVAPGLNIGGDYEFFGRPEWRALVDTYGLHFASRRTMDPSLMYQAASRGDVDVISAFSTDGRIEALDLLVLADDRGAIPPYDALILASPGAQRRFPAALVAMARLDGQITPEAMRRMNRAVDSDGQSPARVAADFLRSLRRSDSPSQAPAEPAPGIAR